jgi:divalent metal cation (Fe/Co/Zn/Cd) transporter
MKRAENIEYPEELRDDLKKARRLEVGTLVYLLTVIVLMYLTLGSSQAMKSAWLEDILSLIPGTVFLIASFLAHKKPTDRFPYGFHGVVRIAFLIGSTALLGMGLFLIYDSGMSLIMQEHPTIGSVILFGERLWLGWLMIPVLLYSAIPMYFIGKQKVPLSAKLHDKVLHTDGDMNRADWQTAAAAILGILGIGAGLWWADSVAALFISFSILRDGFSNVKDAVTDLMDEVPTKIEDSGEPVPLIDQISATIKQLDWVHDAQIRLREEGHVFFGEGFVIPKTNENLTANIEAAARQVQNLDWRMNDFVIMPVLDFEGSQLGE